MKRFKMIVLTLVMLIIASTTVVAGDFDWIKDFNIKAQADPSGFRAKLATRFQVGDAKINMVLGDVSRPADAYMVLRLGEMSNRPPEKVLDVYKANKGKGWGVMAKRLGIKPGSREFHALKRSQDLYGDDMGKGAGKGKGKGKGKGRGKGRDRDRD